MNDFDDFDPTTWLDDTRVLFVQHSPAKRDRTSKLTQALSRAVATTFFGAAMAFSLLGTHTAVADRVTLSLNSGTSSPTGRSEDAPPKRSSMFSGQVKAAAWQSAISLLEGSGVDVAALLQAGVANIEKYSSDKVQFPASFPKDEC